MLNGLKNAFLWNSSATGTGLGKSEQAASVQRYTGEIKPGNYCSRPL